MCIRPGGKFKKQLRNLPEKLMDDIILHELVHTRFRNHGKKFYAELERLVIDQESLDSA